MTHSRASCRTRQTLCGSIHSLSVTIPSRHALQAMRARHCVGIIAWIAIRAANRAQLVRQASRLTKRACTGRKQRVRSLHIAIALQASTCPKRSLDYMQHKCLRYEACPKSIGCTRGDHLLALAERGMHKTFLMKRGTNLRC